MKKFLLSFMLLTSGATFAQSNQESTTPLKNLAQEKGSNSFYASYGTSSILNKISKSIGVFNIGYDRQLSKRFSIGVVFTYSTANGEDKVNSYMGYKYYYNASYSVYGLRTKCYWKNSGKSTIYSDLSIGIADINVEQKSVDGNSGFTPESSIKNGSVTSLSITALGYKYNCSKHLSLFGEVGFLNMGIINLGVGYKL